jgi:hypothetical protein
VGREWHGPHQAYCHGLDTAAGQDARADPREEIRERLDYSIT